MSIPVPLRAQYRQSMNELMRFVVNNGWTLDAAFSEVPVAADDAAALRVIANTELDHLTQYNCGIYNLPRQIVQRWIDSGRPR